MHFSRKWRSECLSRVWQRAFGPNGSHSTHIHQSQHRTCTFDRRSMLQISSSDPPTDSLWEFCLVHLYYGASKSIPRNKRLQVLAVILFDFYIFLHQLEKLNHLEHYFHVLHGGICSFCGIIWRYNGIIYYLCVRGNSPLLPVVVVFLHGHRLHSRFAHAVNISQCRQFKTFERHAWRFANLKQKWGLEKYIVLQHASDETYHGQYGCC